MVQFKESRTLPSILALLVFVLLLPLSFAGNTLRDRSGLDRLRTKVSPILHEEMLALRAYPQYDQPIPLIVKLKKGYFSSPEGSALRGNPNALPLLGACTARLTTRQVEALLDSDLVEYVTLDAVIRADGRTSSSQASMDDSGPAAIGADLVRRMRVMGSGVTVAVFDSGVSDHPDLRAQRISVAMDFTSGRPVETPRRGSNYMTNPDEYGHGTHVAGIIAGDGKKSGGYFMGIAPQANLVDIKVMGSDGSGSTSNLIKAIDWVIRNRERYGIQVANLSLGHPPVESYQDDPLGEAVGRLVESGIVTVASAGNLGKLQDGTHLWGAITSPGNHPSVITVSAMNTKGTADHGDDVATTYSSRGPSYIDNLFKPDLTAPGNAITSLYNPESWIPRNHQELVVDPYYLTMSGSSMATAHVTGTVALMLSVNPHLTPEEVKRLLLLTAIKLQQPHMLEQGNGLVNAYTSVAVAQSYANGPLGRVLDGPFAGWNRDGEEVLAGGAFVVGDRVLYSNLVMRDGQGKLWGEGADWSRYLCRPTDYSWLAELIGGEGGLWSGKNVGSGGWYWADGLVEADGVIWAEDVYRSTGVIWAESILGDDAESFDSMGGE